MGRYAAAEGEARISHAVWETLADAGIEGTTIRSVAERAECTTGMIMHRFGSREHMLRHARELLFLRTAARADAAEASTPDPVSRLEAVLAGVLTLDDEQRQEARIWMGFAAASLRDETLREAHISGTRSWLQRITRLLRACVEHVEHSALARAAMTLVAVAEGLAALSALDPDTYTRDAQRRALATEVAETIGRLRSEERPRAGDDGGM